MRDTEMRDRQLAYFRSELAGANRRLAMIELEAEGRIQRLRTSMALNRPAALAKHVVLSAATADNLASALKANMENRQAWQRVIEKYVAQFGDESEEGGASWQRQ